ncbi:MAG TPA: hypothetical protein VMD08_02470 [Candidatus Baltobacteraceae bacterium]|nr:hypothetical protein [Candidatus Baltobacteraceae bacterium]
MGDREEYRSAGNSVPGDPSRQVRALIIIARERTDIWEHFTRLFANDHDVEVRYDRRSAVHPVLTDRRRQDRRHSARETELRTRHYLIVRKRRRDDAGIGIPTNGSSSH